MAPFIKTRPSSGHPPEDVAADLSIRRLRDGDPDAFEAVFHQYCEALYNFVYPYVRSRETAEELVQDVFCRLWERRATLPMPTSEDGVDAVRAYLYRSVRNAAVSWLRHQRVERELSLRTAGDLRPPGMGGGPPSADTAVHAAEVRTLLRRAIATLPAHYQQVLALRSMHHMSYPEIAMALQIPLKTVESRVTRAFRALRKALEGLR